MRYATEGFKTHNRFQLLFLICFNFILFFRLKIIFPFKKWSFCIRYSVNFFSIRKFISSKNGNLAADVE